MKDPPSSIPWERYLAVDLHKHYLVIGGVNAHQEIVLGPTAHGSGGLADVGTGPSIAHR